MNSDRLVDELNRMARVPGLSGCALVEIEAGMVWHTAGDMPDVQCIAEAASDYWRLYLRLEPQFGRLGELRGSLMWHAQGQLVLLPCGKNLLLAALAVHGGPIDWTACFDQARGLAQLVDRV